MKIGLSYSRCVRDIIDGRVDYRDVLIIISRTDFDPRDDEQWAGIWGGYHDYYGLSNPEWADYPAEDEARFRQLSIDLWEDGKLHQPRKFGAGVQRRPEIWLEAVLPETELESRPAVKEAWDKFQVLAELSSVKLNKEYQ
jgi:hypothetical protein